MKRIKHQVFILKHLIAAQNFASKYCPIDREAFEGIGASGYPALVTMQALHTKGTGIGQFQ